MKNIPITGEYITSQINRSARRVECAKLYDLLLDTVLMKLY
jgi:hypothetical protein